MTGDVAGWYSERALHPPVEMMVVKPDPGVSTPKLLCWTTPSMMSLGLLVETVVEGAGLLPKAELGREVLGSKGLLRLAPLTAKTCKPLYSPP